MESVPDLGGWLTACLGTRCGQRAPPAGGAVLGAAATPQPSFNPSVPRGIAALDDDALTPGQELADQVAFIRLAEARRPGAPPRTDG